MSKNPFKPDKSYVAHPNRNAVDLSHTNHLTGSLGTCYPVLTLETLPGDTFKIDAALGLRFMPLAFPIQTKCKAYVHFFYQRTKNLWDGFQDFIYGNDKLMNQDEVEVPPYINFSLARNKDLLRTCSLGDYLGLPTVKYSSENSDDASGVFTLQSPSAGMVYAYMHKNAAYTEFPTSANQGPLDLTKAFNPIQVDPDTPGFLPYKERYGQILFLCNFQDSASLYHTTSLRFSIEVDTNSVSFDPALTQYVLYGTDKTPMGVGSCVVTPITLKDEYGERSFMRITFEVQGSYNTLDRLGYVGFTSLFANSPRPDNTDVRISCSSVGSRLPDAIQTGSGSALTDDSHYLISALPFRCYESIYNAFYRDNRNNPFYATNPLTGDTSVQYNKYLSSTAGGMDENDFMLRNRNWEYDQFTSAVSSPQQGIAPLVGISSLGDVTFSYEGKNYTFSTETAPDADTITKVNVKEDVPTEVARSIVNTVTSGISINDFRNVNAYQRWLETNIRRGLKYKDQTLARWGVEPKDSTLDMPEFIGGFAIDVDINTVTNTNGSGDVPLGDYAAQATAFGGSKHQISHYCDQHGFIMAILSVVPVPVYTQTLPKMFLRNTALDYYSPEFGQIGLQAIPYRELCPLELGGRNSSSNITPETVFGYQRPWYEYLYHLDHAHGLFRKDFNQFLLSRTFYEPPTLGPDFLTVKESSLNDVFAVHNQNNMLGMIRFDITANRPIPAVSIPSL